QTLPSVIVDIATPPTGGLTPFNAYVALSRSSGEFLRMEDERLEKLDVETAAWW
ncbi:hypothetical protein JB92DRAFT_2572964, partial [Gautieria morchelliformis]